jgi:hypothetical protein
MGRRGSADRWGSGIESESERSGEWVGADRPVPPVKGGGGGARLEWAEWLREGDIWASFAFSFILNFYSLSFLFSLLNSNPTKS